MSIFLAGKELRRLTLHRLDASDLKAYRTGLLLNGVLCAVALILCVVVLVLSDPDLGGVTTIAAATHQPHKN